jgi:hypothetical protein
LAARAETKIPISYNINIGIDTIIWEITSGGVIIAARISTATIECFRNFLKNAGVIIPILVNKYEATGSKKSNPE